MLRVVGDEAVEDEADGRSLLDEIAREGGRRMLVAALETEVAAYLEAHREERDDEGHALVVRNGKGRPEGDGRGGDDPGERTSRERPADR
jgi:putative transposase